MGGKALELLARRRDIPHMVAADINEEHDHQKVSNAAFGAQLEGCYPDIEFVRIDLQNVDETAEVLAKVRPSVIFNSATLQSYRVIELLPKEIHGRFW